ncbi:hypothetical protein SAMN04487995_4735 [Dyadobacter koreensis]|uniref:Uncharacterized protein n=1 Tax=Dyadobacter koreensis TaxID=408657 RepID=A0A1H6YW38_9BACT|nr:hypothetical protein [Dyadobacter koreensis]SEJ45421.1 hypothetical protein SAMN04487995_4735 [Dyadobacter koreensis]
MIPKISFINLTAENQYNKRLKHFKKAENFKGMINIETIKLIPNKENVIVRVCTNNSEELRFNNFRFELHTMCDVPILTFKFERPEDIVLAPINFRSLAAWPKAKALTIHFQIFDLNKDSISYDRAIVLNHDDTEIIFFARLQQKNMYKRQIDAIIDFVKSDYIEFAGLAEVF